MVKNYSALIFIFLFYISGENIFAQKYDYNWLIGYKFDTIGNFNNNLLNFTEDTVFVNEVNTSCNFVLSFNLTLSSIEGNLLLYTNGCQIYDSNHKLILNGDGINPGMIADNFCDNGYPTSQGGIILPTPGKINEYDFLSFQLESTPKYGTLPINLLNHHINCSSGDCIVEYKNKSILQDSFSYSSLMACKHANGVDWWILIPKAQSNYYFRILLNESGFTLEGKQSIGIEYNSDTDWNGQVVFSPDGTKYARYDRGNNLSVYDFDRCTGLLSKPNYVQIDDSADSLLLGCGLAWAPNSKYLYVISGFQVYQFDATKNDLAASKITVANYSDISNQTNFYLAQLAPNNKIYMATTYSNFALHVIENPDLHGLDCNLIPHGLKITSPSQGSLPFFPNYRLGPTDCKDTLNENLEISLYPNPFNDILKINIKSSKSINLKIKIYDVLGRYVFKEELRNDINQLNLADLSCGIYFYQIEDSLITLKSGKLIKYL